MTMSTQLLRYELLDAATEEEGMSDSPQPWAQPAALPPLTLPHLVCPLTSEVTYTDSTQRCLVLRSHAT